jgi:predicted  nucleic acid-binding Zn-ribbon protein
MSYPRSGQEADIPLADGRVLVAGGDYFASTTGGQWAPAELFDPATGQFSVTGKMSIGRFQPFGVRLPDGRILVGGGYTQAGFNGPGALEIYAPSTGNFVPGGNMSAARIAPAAVLLPDGRVMIFGGVPYWNANLYPYASTYIDLYNPNTSSCTSVNIWQWRDSLSMIVLPNGKVAMIGGRMGYANNGISGLRMADDIDLFNPADNSFVFAAHMTTTRLNPGVIVLNDGRLAIIAGSRGDGDSYASDTCEIYDPNTMQLLKTVRLGGGHAGFQLTKLNDGRVLLCGGWGLIGYNGAPSPAAEIFDPKTDTWTSMAPNFPTVGRGGGVASLGADGRVSLVGGSSARAEMFIPDGFATNHPPVANAGPDLFVYAGAASSATVVLDGSASTDADNNIVSYTWSGSWGTASGRIANVTLPTGIYQVTLTVTDLFNKSSTDVMQVAVVPGVSNQSTIDALNQQIATLNAQIDQLTAELKASNDSNASLQAQISSLNTQLQAAQANVTSLQAQVADLTARLAAATDANTTLQQQNAALTTQNQTLTTQNQTLTTQNQTLQTQATADAATIAQLKSDLDAANAAKQTLQTQVTTLTSQLADANAANATLQQQNATLTSQLATANSTIAGLQQQLATATANLQSAQTQLASATAANQTLQAQVDTLTQQNATLTATNQTLQTNNATLTAQLSSANAQVTTLTQQNAQLTAQNQSLQQQQQTTTASLQALQQDLANLFNASFVLPGQTPQDQLQSLVTAIQNLSRGQQQALYKNLGGK